MESPFPEGWLGGGDPLLLPFSPTTLQLPAPLLALSFHSIMGFMTSELAGFRLSMTPLINNTLFCGTKVTIRG